jgi:hypothetical protein
MIILPVEVLVPLVLIIIVFSAGYFVTSDILEQIAKLKLRNQTKHPEKMQKTKPGFLTEDNMVITSIIVGAISVLFIILALSVNFEWFNVRFWLLGFVALGYVALTILIFLWIFLYEKLSGPKEKNNQRLTSLYSKKGTDKKNQQKQNSKHKTNNINEQNNSQKQSIKYQDHIANLQKNKAEKESVKNDFYSLFGMVDDQSQKRGILLENILNRFFNANNVRINTPFELINQMDQTCAEHCLEGIIDIAGNLYLVELRWQHKPVDVPEVSLHLVQIFSRGLSGGILMTNSEFTMSAISTCKKAMSQKTVMLCELKEIVTLMEQNANLNNFLSDKIFAAVIKKNPVFKPL